MKINSEIVSLNHTPVSNNVRADVRGASADKPESRGDVSLSAHAIMLSRLFGGQEPAQSARSKHPDVIISADYLTDSDRKMIEKMYSYSAEHGIDLAHVDALAGDLGLYRALGSNPGSSNLYDAEGRKVKVSLSEADQTAARGIVDGESSTSIDRGFLDSMVTVGGHATNLKFLEKMVRVFSDRPVEPDEVTVGDYDPERSKLVVTREAGNDISIPVADFSYDKTTGKWTTPSSSGKLDNVNHQILSALSASDLKNESLQLLVGFAHAKGTNALDFLDLLNT